MNRSRWPANESYSTNPFQRQDTPARRQAGSRAGEGYGRMLLCPTSVSGLVAKKSGQQSPEVKGVGTRAASLAVCERAEPYRVHGATRMHNPKR
jgi:hypothetical protein